jgi:excisionase family DNA binding protein
MTTEQLLTHGQQLAKTLRTEGRVNDAALVDALVTALDQYDTAELLTVEEVAQQIGANRQSVIKWVKQGWLEGVYVGKHLMIPASAMRNLEELNSILAALDEDRPPATDEEITAALQSNRKDWTWIGKTE